MIVFLPTPPPFFFCIISNFLYFGYCKLKKSGYLVNVCSSYFPQNTSGMLLSCDFCFLFNLKTKTGMLPKLKNPDNCFVANVHSASLLIKIKSDKSSHKTKKSSTMRSTKTSTSTPHKWNVSAKQETRQLITSLKRGQYKSYCYL